MSTASEPSLIEVAYERDRFALDVKIEWSDRVLVLFGPSGSGKSTILECVLGLHPRAKTCVRLAGEWLEDGGQRQPVEGRLLGWVPQSPTLFPHLDVAGNLGFGVARAGAAGPSALAQAIEVLEIGHLLERRVGDLSGGEQSRVALGRALASGARALLLDEPLAALDWPLRARILPYLVRIRDELGLPLLYITHDPDEAMLLGGCVAVLDRGRVVATGPAREVLWSRAALPISEALGIENVLDVRSASPREGERGGVVTTRGGLELFVPFDPSEATVSSVGLRAEDVLLALEEPGAISARNVLRGTVVRCEALAGETLVHLDVGEPLVARLTPGAVARLALERGKPVYAIVKAHALRRLA